MENLNTNTSIQEDENVGDVKATETTDKTSYTRAEMEELLQKEADRRVTEALRKQEKKAEARVREAEKLATMNADERYKYELEQREKAILDKEAKLALAENTNAAAKILAEKGISIALVDFVVAEDAETMDANIKLLENEFKKSVRAEVEKRLASSSPKSNLNTKELTRETFAKMTLAERQELLNSNPELFRNLSSSS